MSSKKILFTVTVLLVVFSFNLSYSQDDKIRLSLMNLQGKLFANSKDLLSISRDLSGISKVVKVTDNFCLDESNVVGLIRDYISSVSHICEYQNYLITGLNYADRDKLNYYVLLKYSLSRTNVELNHYSKRIQTEYPLLKNKAALHTVDKARTNIANSLSEIESTMKVLDNAIKSMP